MLLDFEAGLGELEGGGRGGAGRHCTVVIRSGGVMVVCVGEMVRRVADRVMGGVMGGVMKQGSILIKKTVSFKLLDHLVNQVFLVHNSLCERPNYSHEEKYSG